MPSVFLRKMLSVFLISLVVYTRDSSRVCHSGYKVTHLSSRQRPAHTPATLSRSLSLSLSSLLSRQPRPHPATLIAALASSGHWSSLGYSDQQTLISCFPTPAVSGQWSQELSSGHLLSVTERLKQDNRKIAENFAQ